MQYTLFNRFRGALLGAVAAERSAADSSTQPQAWVQLMLQQAQILTFQEQELPSSAALSAAEVALVTLPIALFYHEEPLLLKATLEQWLAVRQLNSELAIGAQLVGGVLSRSLRERFIPDRLIDELTAELHLPLQHPIVADLQAISLLAAPRCDRQPFEAAEARSADAIHWRPIVLAISSFLASPPFFRLSVLRSAQLAGRESAAIAAALSGAYNGATAIPRGWLRSIDPANISLVAEQLMRQWSGMEITMRGGVLPTEVTAAPRVIRPR